MYGFILFIHVISGSMALLSGLAAMLARKGGRIHRKTGRIFFYSMLFAGSSSLLLAFVKPALFFFHVGVFSLFMTWSGYRAVRRDRAIPGAFERVIFLLAAINTVAMFVSGHVLLLFFGVLSALLLYGERTLFSNKTPTRKESQLRHVRMMVGSYISTLTAFLVVNVTLNNEGLFWMPWVAPTLLFVPFILYHSRKIRKVTAVLLFFLSTAPLAAQPYLAEKSRHRFAQLNMGSDTRAFSSIGTPMKSSAQQRMLIGGTHFWGHADFYIAIPIVSTSKNFKAGVETGFRVYPYRLESGKLRPYGGFALMSIVYQQDNGPQVQRFASPILGGLSYQHGRHLFDLGAAFSLQNKLMYPTDRSAVVPVKTPSLWFSAGYKFTMETTLSAEKNWKNGVTRRLTDTLAALGRLDGITLSLGFSSAFFPRPSPDNPPFNGRHYPGVVFPEFGAGYYLHKADVQFNLFWRGMKTGNSAYGFVQEIKRRALSLETFVFLGDYHGFAPFAGLSISYESLHALERDGTEQASGSRQDVAAGIVAGWDIRPDRLQSFYLRTSIRYFPGISVQLENRRKLWLDALEINFIQLVVLPGRMF